MPSGFTSKVKSIDSNYTSVNEAFAPQSVTITLEDEIDISRGDMIVRKNNLPEQSQDVDMMICWLNAKPMQMNGKYAIKHTSRDARCVVKELKYKMNLSTLQRDTENQTLGMNDIGRISIRTTTPLFFDSYRQNRATGSIILIDEATNETVGAGMIV